MSTKDQPMTQAAEEYGPFDLIFEAAGASSAAFEAIEALGRNGVLVLTGISGGGGKIEVSGDEIMTGLVLGNKVVVGTVNSNRSHFERGVQSMVLAQAWYPGWLERLLTHPVRGLENYTEMMRLLTENNSAIKVFAEISGDA
jgi:threonine dehydrogenase-like Zn-dependent dehydrogenase